MLYLKTFRKGWMLGGFILFCWSLLFVCSGCGESGNVNEEKKSAAAESQLTLFVSILPQKTFVEKITGDSAEVHVMVGPGQNPATYEPTPRQMMSIAQAQVYFRIGVPFENVWIDRLAASNPQMQIVDTRRGIELRTMEKHRHGEDEVEHEEHNHEAQEDLRHKDPHIWLDPRLVKKQADTICEAIKKADPANAEVYRQNLLNFQRELDALDQEIRTILSAHEGRKFMVFHPAWGYFAEAYNLQQIPVELEGKEPSAQDLQEILQIAQEHDIHTIFVQKQFSRKTAAAIAEMIDGQVKALDPLAPDYIENMKRIALALAEGSAE